LMEDFTRSLSRAVLIAAAIEIPIGLVLSGVFGGWHGLAGSAVGFGLAVGQAALAIWILKYALKKPPEMLPGLLMASYFGRLVLIVVVLIGLYYVKALDIVALVSCFGALYLTQITMEMFYAWRNFGLVMKGTDPSDPFA
jgi:hypothetical protein